MSMKEYLEKLIVDSTFVQKNTLLCFILTLVACGGGNSDTTINNANNAPPINVILSNVITISQTAVDVLWIAAGDDTTPVNQLVYEVHMAEGVGNFTPSANTLKFSGKNVLKTQVSGLKVATSYTVKLVAVDAEGLKTVSAFKNVTTLNDLLLGSSLLNDTGINRCVNLSSLMGNCDAAHLGDWFSYNQDAQVGRDALAAKNLLEKVGGGQAGFDFTKISATGEQLSANTISWSCVLDNHTGLMWEKKTDDNGLHDKNNVYTWYNPDAQSNGGKAGYENNGKNTYQFVNTVNSQGLCGYKDWRLPTLEELHSIVNYGTFNPSVDTTYFPNTLSYWYWTSSSSASSNELVRVTTFLNGSDNINYKSDNSYIYLVRFAK